jgi:hypothetical protein
MKSFPVALAIYTITILFLSVVIVHFTFARPINSRLKSMDNNLNEIETDLNDELNTIGYQLEALNTKLTLRQAQTRVDIIEGDEAPKDFDTINQNIDNILSDTATGTFPTPSLAVAEGIGGAIGGVSTASPKNVKVTIKSYQINSIKVFQEPDTQSEVIGSILYGDTYLSTQNVPDWYQITLNDWAQGWVRAQEVKEVN